MSSPPESDFDHMETPEATDSPEATEDKEETEATAEGGLEEEIMNIFLI